MSERERLVELLKKNCHCEDEDCSNCNRNGICFTHREADYLIANGVIVPPVNVGGIVWVIYNKCVTPANVMAVYVDKSGGMFDLKILTDGLKSIINKDYTFDMVFLTEEEAEKSLKAVRSDDLQQSKMRIP